MIQVTKAEKEGDKVKITVEPAKGGEAQTLEADVVLVSAGTRKFYPFGILSQHPCLHVVLDQDRNISTAMGATGGHKQHDVAVFRTPFSDEQHADFPLQNRDISLRL